MKQQPAPIHFLIISPYFAPHIGGSQRYIEELYVHMRRLHPNVRVTVLAYNTDGASKQESYRGLSVIRIPCWEILPGQFSIPNPFALIATLIRLTNTHIQFVHTHIRYFDATWWAWVYARLINARSIFTEHVANHPVHESLLVTTVGSWVDKTIAAWSISQYDIVTTTNTQAKQFLSKVLGITRPITVSYGGVDTRLFCPKKWKRRRIPNTNITIPSRTIVVTYIGRIIWSKGVTYIAQAIKKASTFNKRVQFVIAGNGNATRDVQQIVGASQRVLFPGPLTPNEVKQLLQQTDIFIYPSHHNEGFPNAILEAGASGCFVMATKNAGTGEIIRSEDEGLYLKKKNSQDIIRAIQWAILHPSERHQKGAALRQYVQSMFGWNTISESFYELIQQHKLFQTR